MASSPSFAQADYSFYEPPVALWELVEKDVPPHERQEIRKMLGESLVEQSLELHQEVNTLLDIWRDYREETESIFTKNRLPEPPAARERLKQEIKFFVESIREKIKENGGDAEVILGKHKPEVIDYALDTERAPSSGYFSRPSTARSSRDGVETPRMRGTPLPDRDSNVCSRSEEVEAINDKFTYLKFDEVVQHLRETLEDEVTQLTQDSEFLQSCLDDEADFRCLTGPNREPTLTELREERSQLEKELLSPVHAVPKVLQGIKNSPPALKQMQSSLTPNNSMQQRMRVTSSTPSSANHSKNKPKPLKACHNISPETQSEKPVSQRKSSKASISGGSSGKRVSSASSNSSINNNRKNMYEDNLELFDTPPQHIIVRTDKKNSRVTNTEAKKTSMNGDVDISRNLVPSPPSTAKPSSRPGSAQKFRRMVMESRD